MGFYVVLGSGGPPKATRLGFRGPPGTPRKLPESGVKVPGAQFNSKVKVLDFKIDAVCSGSGFAIPLPWAAAGLIHIAPHCAALPAPH